jgi:Tfp pilus assembly protein PilF
MRALGTVILCFFGAVLAAQAQSIDAAKKTQAAMVFLEQGDLDQALAKFREALAVDPDHVEARLGLAFVSDKQGQVEEAMQEYQSVLALQPQNSLALNNLGVLYDNKGRHEEAIRYFEKALQIDPADQNARNNLANSTSNKALAKERSAKFETARQKVEANPKSPRASYELARLYAAYGEKEQAIGWLEKAISLGFNDFEYLKRDPAIEAIRMDPRFTMMIKGR